MDLVGLGGEKFCGKNTAARILVDKYGFTEHSLAKPLKDMVSHVFGIPFDQLDDYKLKEVPFDEPCPVTYDNVHDIVRYCSNLIGLESFRKTEEQVTRNMIKKVVKKMSTNPMTPQQQIQQNANGMNQLMMVNRPEYKVFETPRKLLQFVGTELVRDCISPYFWCKVLDSKIQHENKVVVTDVRFFEEREYIKVKGGLLIKIERENPQTTPKAKDSHSSENSLGINDEYHYLLKNQGTQDELRTYLETIYNHSKFVKENRIYQIRASEK